MPLACLKPRSVGFQLEFNTVGLSSKGFVVLIQGGIVILDGLRLFACTVLRFPLAQPARETIVAIKISPQTRRKFIRAPRCAL